MTKPKKALPSWEAELYKLKFFLPIKNDVDGVKNFVLNIEILEGFIRQIIKTEKEQAYEQGKTDGLDLRKNYTDIKPEIIKREREEAYQKGFIAGADATGSQINEIKIEEIKKIKEQAVKEVLDLLPKEYEGELDDFSSGFNICRNEIELKINKLKDKYN